MRSEVICCGCLAVPGCDQNRKQAPVSGPNAVMHCSKLTYFNIVWLYGNAISCVMGVFISSGLG